MNSRRIVHFVLVFLATVAVAVHAPLIVSVAGACKCAAEGRVCACSQPRTFLPPANDTADVKCAACCCCGANSEKPGVLVPVLTAQADEPCLHAPAADSPPSVPCRCQLSPANEPAVLVEPTGPRPDQPGFESPPGCVAFHETLLPASTPAFLGTLTPASNFQQTFCVWRD